MAGSTNSRALESRNDHPAILMAVPSSRLPLRFPPLSH